jgi:hypothetical protein
MPNIRLEFARVARPTRKSEALLLAAQPGVRLNPNHIDREIESPMQSISLRLAMVAFAVLCAQASSAQPADGSKQDALALAKAMEVEKFVKEAFEVIVESNIKTGRANQAELDCVKRAEIPFANDVYASGFARVLTDDEMTEALTFFSKPAGKWFLKYSKDLDFQARGLKSSSSDTEVTPEMYADLSKFLRSTASKKLLERRDHETPELKNALGAKMTPIILQCKQQAMPKPSSQR